MTKEERAEVCLSLMHKARYLHEMGLITYYTDSEYHYQNFETAAKELYEVLKAHFEK